MKARLPAFLRGWPPGAATSLVLFVASPVVGYRLAGGLGGLAGTWLAIWMFCAAEKVGRAIGKLQGWHDGYDEATDKLTDWAKEQITPEAMRAAAAVAIRRMMEERAQYWRDATAVKDPELN